MFSNMSHNYIGFSARNQNFYIVSDNADRQNLYVQTKLDDSKGFSCPKNESTIQIIPISQNF